LSTLFRLHRVDDFHGLEAHARDALEQINHLFLSVRIAELIDLFAQADKALEATLRETLTRETLGFSSEDRAEQEEHDGRD
jgi:hypothetical protein